MRTPDEVYADIEQVMADPPPITDAGWDAYYRREATLWRELAHSSARTHEAPSWATLAASLYADHLERQVRR